MAARVILVWFLPEKYTHFGLFFPTLILTWVIGFTSRAVDCQYRLLLLCFPCEIVIGSTSERHVLECRLLTCNVLRRDFHNIHPWNFSQGVHRENVKRWSWSDWCDNAHYLRQCVVFGLCQENWIGKFWTPRGVASRHLPLLMEGILLSREEAMARYAINTRCLMLGSRPRDCTLVWPRSVTVKRRSCRVCCGTGFLVASILLRKGEPDTVSAFLW